MSLSYLIILDNKLKQGDWVILAYICVKTSGIYYILVLFVIRK